ncbi:hypothetical protein NCG97_07365 [Streptomyces lydicamycinicus]|uniref:Helix-turn-helix domain protein n=1 Tax=Streptomyces lydicamycinicus TaxID=1546107 RepID=A0A0P4RE62_9ACTN|nr:hypothetical protein [Streptomyces lydicamycinicus]USA00535.1 hypothetical protein NCG97_07365 [Streptomyces lydicamycinicus]GAO11097.1 Helix-turn-helix domain protein [Streptomyces lydicamycinicus]
MSQRQLLDKTSGLAPQLRLDPTPHESLVKAVLTWTGAPGLRPADYEQIALQLISAARSVANDVRRAAHQVGDSDRGAGVLSDLAYQNIWLGQAGTAIDVLDHALSRTQDPTARSLLHLRKARALAMNGDARACRRDLDAAEHALHSATTAPPAWCSWMSPADLAVDSGRCLIDLGETGTALHQISQGVALVPTARDKTRAVSSPRSRKPAASGRGSTTAPPSPAKPSSSPSGSAPPAASARSATSHAATNPT